MGLVCTLQFVNHCSTPGVFEVTLERKGGENRLAFSPPQTRCDVHPLGLYVFYWADVVICPQLNSQEGQQM